MYDYTGMQIEEQIFSEFLSGVIGLGVRKLFL
jgi:hypothetical protein